MSTEQLNAIKQQLALLSAKEKLDLAEFLKEQAQKDKEMEASAGQTKGSEEQPDPACQREYEWLRQHRHEYLGQYVALAGDRLIAHADSLREVYRLAREAGVKSPFTTRIAAPDDLPFGGW